MRLTEETFIAAWIFDKKAVKYLKQLFQQTNESETQKRHGIVTRSVEQGHGHFPLALFRQLE